MISIFELYSKLRINMMDVFRIFNYIFSINSLNDNVQILLLKLKWNVKYIIN